LRFTHFAFSFLFLRFILLSVSLCLILKAVIMEHWADGFCSLFPSVMNNAAANAALVAAQAQVTQQATSPSSQPGSSSQAQVQQQPPPLQLPPLAHAHLPPNPLDAPPPLAHAHLPPGSHHTPPPQAARSSAGPSGAASSPTIGYDGRGSAHPNGARMRNSCRTSTRERRVRAQWVRVPQR